MVQGSDKHAGEGFEGFIPDLVRRAVERSVQAILHSDEGRKNLMAALMPRELLNTVLQQIDGTKKDAVAMIGREMQQFLQSLNVGQELTKILTSVQFEINTSVRFIPNEDGTLRSEVKASGRPVVTERNAEKKSRKRPARRKKPVIVPESTERHEGRVRAAAEGTRRTVRRVVEQLGERAAEMAGVGEPRD
jgi:hypothetical protein